ncbi:unnamed protein product [Closterium sp. NIES-54]
MSTLAALGFAPLTADPSLFLRTDTLPPPFYVLVYVDDLVFATADTEALALVKPELQKRHICTDLGELRSYRSLQITRDRARRTITLTQSHMVHQVLQRFDFRYSLPQSTPLPTGHSLSAPPSDESVERSGPYPELVGCLMYLMTCTRPDLAYPLSILARYVVPGRHRPEHWEAAKRVLRYLCSTSGMGLVLGGRGPVVLTGHADASWVEDLAAQRSSQGYTFSLGSGSVSWRSTRSSSVLSSSCEAEIYAGAMAAQELRWLTYLLTDLGQQPRSPSILLNFSSSYHPDTDGQTERTNQTMEQFIHATCDDPTTLEEQLPLIESSYNNATSATAQQSPFYLNHGQNPTVPMTPSPDNPTPRAQQIAEILQGARTRAAKANKKANVIAKRNADRRRRPVTYQSGDYVLIDTRNLRLPVVLKLRPRCCGPFQISHMITPVTAHLLLPSDWYISPSFHVSLLRP